MYYVICVAADLKGSKINLQFHFENYGPSLAMLIARVSEAFSCVFAVQSSQPVVFRISAAVIFNEFAKSWDRLERSSQLSHNCQVYVFQPDVLDLPAEIPEPMHAQEFLTGYVSPQRTAVRPSPRPDPPERFEARTTFGHPSPATAKEVIRAVRQRSIIEAHRLNSDPPLVEEGGSILQDERRKIERCNLLTLDELRGAMKKELRDWSTNPK